MKIANSRPVSYNAIHMYLYRNKIKLRIKEPRQFFGTFMVRHNFIREEVDLLQGRVSKSIFVRHYWSPSLKELKRPNIRSTQTAGEITLAPFFSNDLQRASERGVAQHLCCSGL
jgi:hypothetical protein